MKLYVNNVNGSYTLLIHQTKIVAPFPWVFANWKKRLASTLSLITCNTLKFFYFIYLSDTLSRVDRTWLYYAKTLFKLQDILKSKSINLNDLNS